MVLRDALPIAAAVAAAAAVWVAVKARSNSSDKLLALDQSDQTWQARPSPKRRSILITGAASGIGLETARIFLKRGWFVGCFDINEEALEKEFGSLVVENLACIGYLDVRDAPSCAQCVELFLASTGGFMDALFNCAGVLAIDPFDQLDLDRQVAQIDINCKGVVNLTYKSIPALVKTGGCVVTMASLSAIGGIPHFAVYAATKAFVYSLTEALRSEYASQGVRFCDVAAPYVTTPMTSMQSHKGGSFDQKDAFITPEQVAEKVHQAVHQASFYNEHFFVGTGTQSAFRLSYFSRFFGLGIHTDMIYKSQALPKL